MPDRLSGVICIHGVSGGEDNGRLVSVRRLRNQPTGARVLFGREVQMDDLCIRYRHPGSMLADTDIVVA